MIHLTPLAIFLPFSTLAAALRSLSLPFVQEPITHWSILTSVSPISSTVFVFSGRWGNATVGRSVARSITYVSSYSASSSAVYSTGVPWNLPSQYSLVISSTGKIPFFAPASIAIFAIHSLSSIFRCLMPSPQNSIDLYNAPSTPIIPIMCRITSLPLT